MIECCPTSLLSWNFLVSGDGLEAELRVNWVGESGEIVLNGVEYVVEKSGFVSPVWKLLLQGQSVAEANKTSVMTRSFEIKAKTGALTLQAVSPFGRTMQLKGAGCSAMIKPNHPFTRRATISGTFADQEALLFAFWLSLLMWRRSANSSATSS
ncbi:MAG: hypothetical protein ACSHYA_01640 [Opitutaceae bacterium]